MSDTRGSGDWATERTLRELRDKVEKSNDLLAKMSGARIKQADTFAGVMDEVNQSLGDFSDALDDAEKAAEARRILDNRTAREEAKRKQDAAKADAKAEGDARKEASANRRARQQDYKRSFDNLSSSLMTGANSAQGFGNLLERGSNQAITALSGLPFGIGTVLGLAGTLLSTSVGYVITSLTSTRETFVDLYQSGIRFDGSILEMRKSVTAAGLSVSDFDRIAKSANITMSKIGEKRFLDSTTRLAKTFSEFGLTAAQGSEYFAEYLENSRLTGTLYFKTLEEQEQAFDRNIKQQYEINRLTGVTVKAQREAQRKLREESEYQLMMASVGPQMREAIEKIEKQLLIFGPEFAKEAATFFGTGAVRPGGELAQMAPMAPEIIEMLKRGPQGFDAAAMGRIMVSATEKMTPGMVAGLAIKYPAMMNIFARGRQVGLGMTPPPGADTPASKFDETTLATIKTMNALNLGFMKLNSTLTDYAQKALDTFGSDLLKSAEGFESFMQKPGEITGAAVTSLTNWLGNIGDGKTPNWFGNIVEDFRKSAGIFDFFKKQVMDGFIIPLRDTLQKKWDELTELLNQSWKSLTRTLDEWLGRWKESLPSLRNILLGRDLTPPGASPEAPQIRQPGLLPSLPFSSLMRPNVNVGPRRPTTNNELSENDARAMMGAEADRDQAGIRAADEVPRGGLLGMFGQVVNLLGQSVSQGQRIERAIQQGQ